MLQLYKDFQALTDHIINVEDGLNKAEEYMEKLKEELTLLATQKRILDRNLMVLRQKGVVSLIEEYSKIKKEIKNNQFRSTVLAEDIAKMQKAIDTQQKTLVKLKERLEEIKLAIDRHQNNVIPIKRA